MCSFIIFSYICSYCNLHIELNFTHRIIGGNVQGDFFVTGQRGNQMMIQLTAIHFPSHRSVNPLTTHPAVVVAAQQTAIVIMKMKFKVLFSSSPEWMSPLLMLQILLLIQTYHLVCRIIYTWALTHKPATWMPDKVIKDSFEKEVVHVQPQQELDIVLLKV